MKVQLFGKLHWKCHEICTFGAYFALGFHTNNMSNGILPLFDETLKLLQTKHPEAKIAKTEVLLRGLKKPIHSSFWWYWWKT